GAGSIVAMIKESTGKEPEMITGKPNPWVLDFIIEKYSIDPSELLIIGDRVDIDVLMGIKKGIDTLYILTGVGKPDDPEKYGVEPTYITRDLMEFYRRYRNYFPE
ncbi:MAG: haloacid dehalogenase, partial [Desulfurococcales archaeon ex4484_58]